MTSNHVRYPATCEHRLRTPAGVAQGFQDGIATSGVDSLIQFPTLYLGGCPQIAKSSKVMTLGGYQSLYLSNHLVIILGGSPNHSPKFSSRKLRKHPRCHKKPPVRGFHHFSNCCHSLYHPLYQLDIHSQSLSSIK